MRNLSSRVVSATLNQVIEHLVAALDDVRFQAALDLGNLVIVLVADTTVSNLATGLWGADFTRNYYDEKQLHLCNCLLFSGILDSHPRFA